MSCKQNFVWIVVIISLLIVVPANLAVATSPIIDPPDVVMGDINGDGEANYGDVPGFTGLIASGVWQVEGDFTKDGAVTLSDLSGFLEAITKADD